MTQPPPERKSKLPARVHPDERTRVETLNALNRQFHGAPQTRPPLSYYSPILIQCTLPHSDPQARDWKRTNGDFTLIISSGVDSDLNPYGVPYGSFPRLVLAYIITNVIQTGERRVELSSHFSGFLREIGYTGNHWGNGVKGRRVREQLVRLLRASITFENKGDGHFAALDVKIAPRFELWFDTKKPEQGSLFESYIDISEEFRQAILHAPVPLLTSLLATLKKSPLALDVYMWLSYRLFTMQANGQEEVSLSYGMLQAQFGTGIAEENYRQFRKELKLALAKVAEAWNGNADNEKQHLKYDLEETGLTLYRTPLLVAKARPSATEQERQRVLTARRFDEATRKQARQLAGSMLSVDWLESQYFAWIEQKGITPADPKAHFFDFIKTHRKRQGETV